MVLIRKPIIVEPLDLGTVTCGNARLGHGVQHLNRHKAPGLTWKTEGNGNIWARGDLGATKSIDFCALVSANALAGTQIRLRLGTSQAEVDGTAPYDSGAIDFINPSITREDGLYHSHLELDATESARWWRIDISGHTGDFEAMSLILGEMIQPSRYYNYDFEYGLVDLGDVNITRWGVFDETAGQVWRTLDFALAWQTEAEFEASFRPMLERLGQRGILYCVFDPEETTYRQARTYMGVLRKPVFARGVRKPKTFLQEFSILSMI